MHSFVFQRYTNRIKVPVWKKYQCYGVIFSPTVSSKSVFDVQVKPLSVALVCTIAGVVIAMASAVISPAEPLFAIDLHRTFQNPMKRRMMITLLICGGDGGYRNGLTRLYRGMVHHQPLR